MEFLVEDGSIVEGANSYVSVAEAGSILFYDPYRLPVWEALEEGMKEKLLVSATSFLERNYKFAGRVVSPHQSLLWPRIEVYDLDFGFYIPSDSIPRKIKEAVVEIALWIHENGTTSPSDEDNISLVRSDEVEVRFDTTVGSNAIPNRVRNLLGSLGSFLGGEMRAIKIVRT